MEKSKLEKYREKSGYGRWTSVSWKTKAWRFAP